MSPPSRPFELIGANHAPLEALAIDGEVVIIARGPRALDAAFTPEAILASLTGLRLAAEEALAQRDEAGGEADGGGESP